MNHPNMSSCLRIAMDVSRGFSGAPEAATMGNAATVPWRMVSPEDSTANPAVTGLMGSGSAVLAGIAATVLGLVAPQDAADALPVRSGRRRGVRGTLPMIPHSAASMLVHLAIPWLSAIGLTGVLLRKNLRVWHYATGGWQTCADVTAANFGTIDNTADAANPDGDGWACRVECSNTMPGGSWITVQDDIVGTGGSVKLTDPSGAAQTKRFYRILVTWWSLPSSRGAKIPHPSGRFIGWSVW